MLDAQKKAIMELKSTVNKMKNLQEEHNSKFDLAEERIDEFEDRLIEIMQSEAQRMKKNE